MIETELATLAIVGTHREGSCTYLDGEGGLADTTVAEDGQLVEGS